MIGKAMAVGTAAAVIFFHLGGVSWAQDAGREFPNGCVVREWEADATPSYRVNDPVECSRLDQRIDRGDGPQRGRVRSEFRGGTRPPAPRRGAPSGR